MSAITTEIAAAIGQIGIASLSVYDNGVPTDARAPYVALWSGVATPDVRTLSGAARQSSGLWQAVCVSNKLNGVCMIATALIDALDGTRIGGEIATCPFASSPQKDTSDPSDTVWTVTIDIAQKGAR